MKEATFETPKASQDEGSETEELEKEWQSLDWRSIEKQVSRMQTRISKAASKHDTNDMLRLSYLLTHSFYAKALAVKLVCSNKGSHTSGIDNVFWTTDAQKMQAVKELDPNHYHAKPLRRVGIPKKNGKVRYLGIPTMHDRAMQTLYWLALDPICEATSDPNSYGFRKGRCCQDAIEKLFLDMAPQRAPKLVLEGDIKGCFDHISHSWLMENIPMERRILHEFLKAGYIWKGGLFPTEEGTPQGGSISPTLANMALNGMEPLVKEHFPKGVTLTRYADDFIVVVPDEETAETVEELLVEFLKERGLELSLEKTLITDIDDGFDFLGFNLRKYNGKMIIKPSKKAFENIKENLREVVLGRGKAKPQAKVICELNPKIAGWCNYYNKVCSKKTFSALHDYLFTILKQWAHRRHSRKDPHWVLAKYWHKVGDNEYVFSDGDFILKSPKSVAIRRHFKVRGTANPYIDRDYFERRSKPGHTTRKACPKATALNKSG